MSTDQDDSANKAPKVVARALRLLCHKALSAAELRRTLAAEGYDEADQARALSATRGWGYVHDARLAESVGAAADRRGRGSAWLRDQLARRALADVDTEALTRAHRAKEPALLADLLARRFPDPQALAVPKVRARATRFLLGRGFAPGQVMQALRQHGQGMHAADDGFDPVDPD